MIPIVGLVAGVVLGLVFEPTVPLSLQPYLPIAVVAALDAEVQSLAEVSLNFGLRFDFAKEEELSLPAAGSPELRSAEPLDTRRPAGTDPTTPGG